MKLTKDQDKALVAIERWLSDKSSPWLFCLSGYAGTGKTTLLKKLVESTKRDFLACAPTGKAASVLRSKLKDVKVATVHQLLYIPRSQSLKTLEDLEAELQNAKANDLPIAELKIRIKEERDRLKREGVGFSLKSSPEVTPGKLIIVDEASMVSEEMRDDFERTGAKVLFVGDSGQLPPVRSSNWFLEATYDASLTEVLRQALDSPIIRLSMQVRNGAVKFEEFEEGDCVITTKDKLDIETWLSSDQVLTGTNAARHRINRFFRKQLGFAESSSGLPVKGEKMICLKNDHYKLPAWINGVQFRAEGCEFKDDTGECILEASYEGSEIAVDFYPFHCQRHYNKVLEEEPREYRRGLFEADFAYAVTVHKSQGSEWPFVILADDGMQLGNIEFRKRWLYTGITRASKRFILVRN